MDDTIRENKERAAWRAALKYSDPFEDETPVAPTCDTENPEGCEACD